MAVLCRFEMKRGIKERFGEAAFDKVMKLGQVESSVKSDTGEVVKFMITKQVGGGVGVGGW